MNIGLLRRALRETLFTTAMLALMLMLFAAALNYAFPRFQSRISAGRMRLPPTMEKVRSAMLGVETAGMSAVDIAASIAWSHPVILAVLFAHAIILSTRIPASEIERGTIDSLMGLPITRWQLWLSETLAGLLSAGLLICAAVIGSRIGNHFVPADLRSPLAGVLKIQVNILGIYAAAAGLGALACSLTSRRGRAVLVTLIAVLCSFLLNYISLLWEEARPASALSLLHYYRPAVMLREGAWPWSDLAVLFGFGAGAWLIGGIIMARRDLATT